MQLFNCVRKQPRADRQHGIVHFACGHALGNRYPLLKNNVAGVELFVDQLNCDAAFALAVDQRPFDRRGAPQFRQKRRMQIYRFEARHGEHLGGDNPAVRNHHKNVGVCLAQLIEKWFVTKLRRMQHLEVFLEREIFCGAALRFQMPSCGFVVARYDERDVVSFSQFLQIVCGDAGCSEKSDFNHR